MSFLQMSRFKVNFSTIFRRPNDALWPVFDYDDQDIPFFIFLLTPPFSGSTAIAKIIQTVPNITELHSKAEGQWLVKGLCTADRWNPSKQINYESVKSIWLNRYQNSKVVNGSLDTIIEKSPPNMVRIKELQQIFTNHFIFINNRNPYACCSSRFHRGYHSGLIHAMSESQRRDAITQIVQAWVDQSTLLMKLSTDHGYEVITYEQFCERPDLMADVLSRGTSVQNLQLNTSKKIQVKNYPEQVVTNMNSRQIQLLTEADFDTISAILGQNETVLNFFGYEIINRRSL